MQENYLAKWLNNELSAEELQEFENSREFRTYQRIAEASSSLRGPAFDSSRAYNAILERRGNSPKVVRLRPMAKLWRVAAAIAVIFTVSLVYISTLDERITTEYAERAEITLPDNSEVVLNADTQITYDEDKWAKDRNINLSGEAFFKVAKGQTFTVKTQAGTVEVLGTQFNVENRGDFFEVTCYEGVVGVTYNKQFTELNAGQSFIVIDGEVSESTSVLGSAPSWLDDESSFKSIPLGYVFDEIERQYNIRVQAENIDLSQLFTGTFSNTNLNLALESISTPTRLAYDVQGNKVRFYAKNTP